MSASASSHRERAKLVAFALFGLACGPPKVADDVEGEAASGDDSTSSSSSSSETGTTETSTSETGTTETGTTETGSFLPGPDVWEENECDPYAQDCPDGEKCVPYGSTGGNWDAHKCVPLMGNRAPGEPCTYGGTVEATDDCDATSICWDVMDVEGEPIGICTPFCTGTRDTPQCPPGTAVVSGSSDLCLCFPTCDPVLQDCGEGLACYWANNGFNCIFTTEDIPPGEPCSLINDCVVGSGCLTAEVLPSCADSACCSPWCEVGGGDGPCEALPGTTCVPFFEQGMAPFGYEHVGVCILP